MRNNTFINALLLKETEYTPVWMMRQAGRYLPEYKKIRAKAGSFMDLCRHVEMACEVSLQPLERFPLDAAILFSDILTIPDAMGQGLYFVEGEGPKFHKTVRTQQDIDQLEKINPKESLDYVCKVASQLKGELINKVPLIGFSGSPWTIATYMIEGQSPGQSFTHSREMLYSQPELLNQLIDKLIISVSDYLIAQIDSGVDVVQIFDTWGGVLSESSYEKFSLNPIKQIIKNIKQKHPNTPCIVFTKGGGLWLDKIADCGANTVGLDWTCELSRARKLVAGKVSLQGNLDPAILRSAPDNIKYHTKKMLDSYGNFPGHAANLGHGITPDVPPEHAKVFINTVHEHSAKIKGK